MKATLLSILLITYFISPIRAQIAKGSVMLGGSFSYSKGSSDQIPQFDYGQRSFNVAPSLGFAKKIML